MALARRNVLVGVAVALTAVFFTAAFAYGYWGSGGWYVQSIEACKVSAEDVAITIDSEGALHMAFVGMVNHQWAVRYAVRIDGDWEVSTVGAASDHSHGLRLFIDGGSRVHVSWWDSETGFRYAYGTPDGFEVALVDIDDFQTGSTAVDSAGTVHGLCGIRRWVNEWPDDHWEWEIQYWMVSSGEWVHVNTFYPPDNTTGFSHGKLLVHEDGDPQTLVYFTSNLTDRQYCAMAAVTDSGLEIGEPFKWWYEVEGVHDAELDSQGMMHLAVERYDRYEHRFYDGLDWTVEFVDYTGDGISTGPNLLMGSQDTAYLIYKQESYVFDISLLRIAERRDGVWSIAASVDGAGSAFGYDSPALAVDADGNYHVARFVFDGHSSNVLTYANTDSGEVLVEELVTAGRWTALVAVIGFPTAFALLTWRTQRRKREEKLARLGLYDNQLKRSLRRQPPR